MIYTVTFNPAIDYVLRVSKLKRGGMNRCQSEEPRCGGKGINVSIALHNLGYESVALGFVGGFTGEALEKNLQARGINVDFIRLSRGLTRLNVKLDDGVVTEINGSGPEIGGDELQGLVQKLEGIGDGDILVLAGSVPDSLDDDTYERILRGLQSRKILSVVDAGGELLVKTLKYKPFLIKPNQYELAEIFSGRPVDEEEILEQGKELRRMGARNVLISMGEGGALLLDETGGVQTLRPPQGRLKYAVGAGDSMIAGFLAGYLSRQDYGYALKMAVAAGSAAAFSGSLAQKEEVAALMGRMDEKGSVKAF